MSEESKTVNGSVSLITLHSGLFWGLAITLALLLLACAGIAWMVDMPGKSYEGPFTQLTSMEEVIKTGLKNHVYALAVDIGERNMRTPTSLDRAKQYITERLRAWGYYAEYHQFNFQDQTLSNIVAEIPGKELENDVVIVGGHYDSVVGTVGANDNGSGVAVTLELARRMCKTNPQRTLRFLFFVNEEPPYFQTDGMGSHAYARSCREKGENIVAALSMETMGYYRNEPNTQKYPIPFLRYLYPNTGNFIAFIGNASSRVLVRESVAAFRHAVSFPSEGIATMEWIPGIGWSDHWSFWQQGYPALMVTDTAPFRYPHYHTDSDLEENIDYARLARVTHGLEQVVYKHCRLR